MKKICAVILAVIIAVSIVGCGNGGNKLSGSFVNQNTGERYEFLITDSGRGEYGGELKIYDYYGELDESHAWYIENNIVYIDGIEEYGYDGKYIYGLYTLDWVTVEDGDKLSGQSKNWDSASTGAMMFTGVADSDRWCYYIKSSNLLGIYVPYMVNGTYTVEDSIIRIYDEEGNLDFTYIIIDNAVHNTVLIPV